MTALTRARIGRIRNALEDATAAFEPGRAIASDPIGLVRALDPDQREVAAHIAAPLAYGGVKAIRAAIAEVFAACGGRPGDMLTGYRYGDFVRLRPDFVYRMTRAEDLDAYFTALSTLRGNGTLGAAFASLDDGDGDVRTALSRYVEEIRRALPNDRRGTRYLTPDPRSGSATKRWYLMLRWLVRADDGVDLGLWSHGVSPARLVLPLDTHVARLARALGLTSRRTTDYRTAREATDALLAIDADDPLRFDMPLCHLGISGACLHRWHPPTCTPCALRPACAHVQGAPRA